MERIKKYLQPKQKKSMIVRWVYSYILILLIPTIAGLVNYYYNTQIAKKEILQANQFILGNLQENIDEYLSKEMHLLSYIAVSPDFVSLTAKDEMNSAFYGDVSDVLEDISDYLKFDSELSYLIYLKDKDYVLWDNRANTSSACYGAATYYKNNSFSYDEWMELIGQEYSNEFFLSPFFDYSTHKTCLVYANTINRAGYEPATLFAYIPMDEITRFMHGLDEDMIFVASQSENVIFTMDQQGITETKDDWDGYVRLEKNSGFKRIRYEYFVAENKFWEETIVLRNVFTISMLLAMAVAAAGIAVFSRQNYRPLKKLLTKYNIHDSEGDEFEKIENMLENMNMEQNRITEQMIDQRKYIQQNWILSKMKGRDIGKNRDTEDIFALGSEEVMILAGFQIPYMNEKELMHDEILWFALDNVFTELMSHKKMYQINDGIYLFYLFVVDRLSAEEWKRNCIEQMNYVCRFFSEKCSSDIRAVISNPESELDNLRFMYQDLIDAFEYSNLLGGMEVIDTASLEDTDKCFRTRSIVAYIENVFLQEDYEKLMALSDKIFDNHMQYVLLRMQVLEVFQMVVKCFENYEQEETQRLVIGNYLTALIETKNESDMRTAFDTFLAYIIKSMQRKESSDGIVNATKEYIEKNYADARLNINYIADSLNKNARYISRVFKEETEEGILDYINDIRVDKAKQLLRTKQYSVKEIGEMVGYASDKTFIRIFRKLAGTTPGKYAEAFGNLESVDSHDNHENTEQNL